MPQGTPNAVAPDNPPVLWHLKASPYNEKARWALDYKGVPHLRRAVDGGRHHAIARKLTGGTTFPVLVLDGEAIGDSTEIIEALERSHPDPQLYPSDPQARRRALELEDFFDEELGPYVRRLVVHNALADSKLTLTLFTPDMGRVPRLAARAAFPRIRRRVAADMDVNERTIERAYEKIRVAGERFRAELAPSGYLSGDGFTVADLTAAAMVAPAIAPEQFPYPQPQRGHHHFAALRAALAEAGMLEWARGMYVRHRGRSAEVASTG